MVFNFHFLNCNFFSKFLVLIIWGRRIRTSEWRDQNPQPYHLAIPQFLNIYNTLEKKIFQRQLYITQYKYCLNGTKIYF